MGHNQSHQKGYNVKDSSARPKTHKNGKNTSSVSPSSTSSSVSQLPAVNKLAQILLQKTSEEEHVDGITGTIFQKYIFPKYKDIANRLFTYFVNTSETGKNDCLSQNEFIISVEKFLNILPDGILVDMYLKMYSENDSISPDGFQALIFDTYTLTIDHYPGGPVSCPYLERTVNAVVDSAFRRKSSVSVSFLVNWIMDTCPRLILATHRYIVHVLSTAYRNVGGQNSNFSELELTTPVLEREQSMSSDQDVSMLAMSQVWFLALALPNVYVQPSEHHSPVNKSNGLTSQNSVSKLLGSVCPSHWVSLYMSSMHGLGSNRFQHHVTGYRGPTVTVIRGSENMEFVVGTTTEWSESIHYWGGPETIVIQLLPFFQVLERGPKLVYFNDSIRGYPKGICVGSDPRRPMLKINDHFTQVLYREAPYQLLDVEVWGCGSDHEREAQLDVKRWQVKDAEKVRKVKINPEDWTDHPDRYILELGGHPTYSVPPQNK